MTLDERSLEISKKVCRTWNSFIALIANQKLKWIQIIKTHEENVRLQHYPLKYLISSGQKPKWSNLRIQSLRKFVNRLNSEKDESKKIEMFLEKYAELKVELTRSMSYKKRV